MTVLAWNGRAMAAAPSDGADYDVRTFGAVGDGLTLNTTALQSALDACHDAGGGRVTVPQGTFLTGTIRLRSGTILHLAEGAVLRGSPRIEDYPTTTAPLNWGGWWAFISSELSPCLIYAEDARDIGIEGPGTIDGQGGLTRKVFPNPGDRDRKRPMLLRTWNCRGVTVRDVTFRDPASFTTFFVRSEDITIENITIRSRETPNGDGLNFNGCRKVRISHSDLDCGDDAISPKTTYRDWPNEDFVITHCRMSSEWAAIRLGPESIAPMRRFVVENCLFVDCKDGIKLESCGGSILEDLVFRDIEMRDVNRPFYVTATRFRFSAEAKSVRPEVGRIRGVTFQRIRAEIRAGDPARPFERNCAAIVSLLEPAIEAIELNEVEMRFPGRGTEAMARAMDIPENLHSDDYMAWARPFAQELPASTLYLRHLRDVHMEKVTLVVREPDARPFIVGEDVTAWRMRDVLGIAPSPVPALVKAAANARPVITSSAVMAPGSSPVLIDATAEEEQRMAEVQRQAREFDAELARIARMADVAEGSRQVLRLPTLWRFRLEPGDRDWSQDAFSAEHSEWKAISVEQPWTQQGIPTRSGHGWYAVEFRCPELPGDRKVLLRFGSIRGRSRAWIDGDLVGERAIAPEYVTRFPWVLDVTRAVEPGQVHSLVVEVTGTSLESGLTGTVELLVPEAR